MAAGEVAVMQCWMGMWQRRKSV